VARPVTVECPAKASTRHIAALRRLKQRRSHLRRKKSKRVLRSLDKDQPVAKASRKRVRRLLGGLRQRSQV
jgi:ribosomal protein L35